MVHPHRVMELCKSVTDDEAVLSAALLHDVLEDTPLEAAVLLSFLSQIQTDQIAAKTLKLVIELTDVFVKNNYPQFNGKERKASPFRSLMIS